MLPVSRGCESLATAAGGRRYCRSRPRKAATSTAAASGVTRQRMLAEPALLQRLGRSHQHDPGCDYEPNTGGRADFCLVAEAIAGSNPALGQSGRPGPAISDACLHARGRARSGSARTGAAAKKRSSCAEDRRAAPFGAVGARRGQGTRLVRQLEARTRVTSYWWVPGLSGSSPVTGPFDTPER